MSATTCPWPAPARARACCSASSSGCRPTKGDSPRATAACKRRRRAVTPTSSHTATGSARPFTGTSPSAVTCDKTLRQAQRVGRQPDAARRRQLLHPRRQVRGLAYRCVVHVQIVANGAHHHGAGVEPDAQLHLHAMRVAHLLRVAAHGLLHGQGGIAGPHRVILMRQRGAEQRHNAIAQDLIHRAFVAVHGVHHEAQGGVQQGAGLFRVETGDEFGGALDVGKEHRDLLALAFKSRTRRQNFLAEMRRGVGQRRAFRRADRRWRGVSGPDQDGVVLVGSQLLGLDDLDLEVFQVLLIQAEPPPQGAVGHPALATQYLHHLGQHLLKCHACPLTPDTSSIPGDSHQGRGHRGSMRASGHGHDHRHAAPGRR